MAEHNLGNHQQPWLVPQPNFKSMQEVWGSEGKKKKKNIFEVTHLYPNGQKIYG